MLFADKFAGASNDIFKNFLPLFPDIVVSPFTIKFDGIFPMPAKVE